ncbi:MAG: GNAT family N-acetyltransferase [Haloplanus sp.]
MIRAATPADAPTLARLQSFLPEPSPDLLESALDAAAVTPATALVSTADTDAPVAYLLAVPGDAVYVAELVVAPDHRREGRARALLDACAARAGPDATLTVTVASDNETARSCYRACGFEKEGTVPDFFDGGDGVRYRRD